jgi:glyoxylase-like metal-dependent hydrolase (beta-lactamase superfamily II)
MQEIAPHVYIENAYPGVTLGAISLRHGLVLIDSPFRSEDIRTWRSALLNMGGGVDRLMVNLDAHPDRLLGTRAMECTVVSHDEMAQAYQSRALAVKFQSGETGAEWERYDNLGSIRWTLPEITFTDEMIIHWDDEPIILENCPGSSIGSIRVHLPHQRILFLGDLVTPGQPPFLALADVPTWVNSLQKLLTPEFQEYLLISGRGGLVRTDQVRRQITLLEKIREQLDQLAKGGAEYAETEALVPGLLAEFKPSAEKELQYRRRLSWGLSRYYIEHYFPAAADTPEAVEI